MAICGTNNYDHKAYLGSAIILCFILLTGRLIHLRFGSEQNMTAEPIFLIIQAISICRKPTSCLEQYLAWKGLIFPYHVLRLAEIYTDQWAEITSLEQKQALTDEEEARLAQFIMVLCADFQMCKLVLYWGYSPQLGSTYYLQKLNHDVFGTVNHATGSSTVYLCDERLGPKNTDHTYIIHQ